MYQVASKSYKAIIAVQYLIFNCYQVFNSGEESRKTRAVRWSDLTYCRSSIKTISPYEDTRRYDMLLMQKTKTSLSLIAHRSSCTYPGPSRGELPEHGSPVDVEVSYGPRLLRPGVETVGRHVGHAPTMEKSDGPHVKVPSINPSVHTGAFDSRRAWRELPQMYPVLPSNGPLRST